VYLLIATLALRAIRRRQEASHFRELLLTNAHSSADSADPRHQLYVPWLYGRTAGGGTRGSYNAGTDRGRKANAARGNAMTEPDLTFAALPANARTAFRELAELLMPLAGERLLELAAFGGWLVDDPLYHGTPARSVAVLAQVDLRLLDQLARAGVRLGNLGLSAPLTMTPAYITASCDTFPLELLEVQQQHVVLVGQDHFAALRFEPAHVRLQCERELKSELLHLRQGLLAAAGNYKQLGVVCRQEAERSTRVLRGLLHLAGTVPGGRSAEIIAQAAGHTGLQLDGLAGLVAAPRQVDFAAFERFYQELTALAEYMDRLDQPAR
jgi:hypothetical protein